jgi:hypothetical protein
LADLELVCSKKNYKTHRFLGYFVLSLLISQFDCFDLMVVHFGDFKFDLFQLLANDLLGILLSLLFLFVLLLQLVLDAGNFGVFDLIKLSS